MEKILNLSFTILNAECWNVGWNVGWNADNVNAEILLHENAGMLTCCFLDMLFCYADMLEHWNAGNARHWIAGMPDCLLTLN